MGITMTAKKSKAPRKKKSKNLFARAYGTEPDFSEVLSSQEAQESLYMQALAWYRNCSTGRDEKKWTVEYMKQQKYSKDDIRYVSANPVKSFVNVGRYFRMLSRGAVLDASRVEDMKSFLDKMKTTGKEKKSVPTDRKNVQDYINEQIVEYLSCLELEWDTIVDRLRNKEDNVFSMYSWLKSNNVKSVQAKRIRDYWSRKLPELESAVKKDDKQLVEAYSYVGRVVLKRMHRTLNEWVSDCDKYYTEAKSTRKKRRRTKT